MSRAYPAQQSGGAHARLLQADRVVRVVHFQQAREHREQYLTETWTRVTRGDRNVDTGHARWQERGRGSRAVTETWARVTRGEKRVDAGHRHFRYLTPMQQFPFMSG